MSDPVQMLAEIVRFQSPLPFRKRNPHEKEAPAPGPRFHSRICTTSWSTATGVAPGAANFIWCAWHFGREKEKREKALNHREMRAKSENRQTTGDEPQIISEILMVCTRWDS